ncbi:MAG: hypothetical protein DRG30_02145 [Epsilonproteobacteria bacterium]|nr:MAG: hypothetical protein DRG30_02145 [Campylobacterota bacterium]
MKNLILSTLLLSVPLLATENLAITNAPENISLTIYGSNLAMISEKRSAMIDNPGSVKLMYPGVPSLIDTSSVIAIFSQPVRLFSQNYSYDVISYSSLLKYHTGRVVRYTDDEESTERKEGTLLSTNPILIREKDEGAIHTPYKVFFPSIPKEMAIKPSLFWNIKTDTKELDIDLKYLTKGLSWKSDYTIDLLDDNRLNLNSWVTITNNSGATYHDADITVLAGDVNMPKKQEIHRVYAKSRMAAVAEDGGNIQNEAFSGYHIYKIPFRETIKDKEKKQISFIGKKAIAYEKYAFNKESFYFSNFGERKLRFSQIVEFKNSEENHLGIPLPKGTVRVYKEDQDKVSRFVGASTIRDIPKDETVKLTIGKYFDIVGKEKIVDFRQTKRERHISYEITVNNHSQKDEVIKLYKSVPTNQGKLTITDTCSKQCSKEQLNAFEARYTIALKPDEAYKMTISYDMKMY